MPTNRFVRACVEVKFMAIPSSCIFSCNKAGGGFGGEQCWVLLWIANEDFGCITYMHRAQLPHISPVRWNRKLFTFLWCAGCSCCSLLDFKQIGRASMLTNIFAHACVVVKFTSIHFSCIPFRIRNPKWCFIIVCSIQHPMPILLYIVLLCICPFQIKLHVK